MGPQILKKLYKKFYSTAQYITEAKLPGIQDLYTRQCQEGPKKLPDFSHPSQTVLSATAQQAVPERQV